MTDDFSLYLHIPYCPSKCPYCDFNSYAATRWPEADYVAALIAEIEHYAAMPPWNGGRLRTIFFGGGTPSMFAPESIGAVLTAVRDRFGTTSALEVTLEANPGTISLAKLRGFRAVGINRISFGVQSFNATHLARLGRVHSAAEAVTAIELARAAGFADVNLDLIFAVPGQTLGDWDSDLHTAVSLGTDHLSIYNLTYEEGTAFHAMRGKGELTPLSEEIEVAMFTRAQEVLGAAGYGQYEISNYARPGHECRHNLNYWHAGAYLGVGAGAHSFAITSEPGTAGGEPSSGVTRRRWSNEKSPPIYISRARSTGHARATSEELSAAQAAGEFVFLGLRCLAGIDSAAFARRFGAEFLSVFPHSESLRRDGLLLADGALWRLSERGLMVADSVFATYL